MVIGENFLTYDNQADMNLVIVQPFTPRLGNNNINTITIPMRWLVPWQSAFSLDVSEVENPRWNNTTASPTSFTVDANPGYTLAPLPKFFEFFNTFHIIGTFSKTAIQNIDYTIRMYNATKTEVVTCTIQDLSAAAYSGQQLISTEFFISTTWDGINFEIDDNSGTSQPWEGFELEYRYWRDSVKLSIHEYFDDGTLNTIPIENGVSALVGVTSPGFTNNTFTFTNCYVENRRYAIVMKPAELMTSFTAEAGIKEDDGGVTPTFDEPLILLNGLTPLATPPTPIVSDIYYLAAQIDYTITDNPDTGVVWDCDNCANDWVAILAEIQAKLDEIYTYSALTIQFNSGTVPTKEDWEREWQENGGELPIPTIANLIWYDNSQEVYGGWYKMYNDTPILIWGIYTQGMGIAIIPNDNGNVEWDLPFRPAKAYVMVESGQLDNHVGQYAQAGITYLDGSALLIVPGNRIISELSKDYLDTNIFGAFVPVWERFTDFVELMNEWQ